MSTGGDNDFLFTTTKGKLIRVVLGPLIACFNWTEFVYETIFYHDYGAVGRHASRAVQFLKLLGQTAQHSTRDLYAYYFAEWIFSQTGILPEYPSGGNAGNVLYNPPLNINEQDWLALRSSWWKEYDKARIIKATVPEQEVRAKIEEKRNRYQKKHVADYNERKRKLEEEPRELAIATAKRNPRSRGIYKKGVIGWVDTLIGEEGLDCTGSDYKIYYINRLGSGLDDNHRKGNTINMLSVTIKYMYHWYNILTDPFTFGTLYAPIGIWIRTMVVYYKPFNNSPIRNWPAVVLQNVNHNYVDSIVSFYNMYEKENMKVLYDQYDKLDLNANFVVGPYKKKLNLKGMQTIYTGTSNTEFALSSGALFLMVVAFGYDLNGINLTPLSLRISGSARLRFVE